MCSFVCVCTQFLRYLVDEDAIEDVQGAQHYCDRVCVYPLTTASIRVSSLLECDILLVLTVLYSGIPVY